MKGRARKKRKNKREIKVFLGGQPDKYLPYLSVAPRLIFNGMLSRREK